MAFRRARAEVEMLLGDDRYHPYSPLSDRKQNIPEHCSSQ